MAKFRKKPVVIEATQWFKMGDHAAVKQVLTVSGELMPTDGGVIMTLEGRIFVSKGDWIITGSKGEHYTCKPSTFEQTYEALE